MVARTDVITIQQPGNYRRLVRARAAARTAAASPLIWIFLAGHFLLGAIIARVPLVASGQLIAVLALAVWWGLVKKDLERLSLVAAYLAGAEVLWRMTRTGPLWEFGKYGLIVILAVSLLRAGRLRAPIFALTFFAALLPSLVLPLANVELQAIRDDLSFYLSGPLALTICTWFFSSLRVTFDQLQRILYALLGPTICLGAVTLYGTLSAESLRFSNNSNFATSGGFGPNQVAAALGLGILVAFLALQHRQAGMVVRLCLLMTLLFLTVQSAMTFSRSGIYMAAGAIVTSIIFLVREPRFRIQLLIIIGIAIIAFNYLLLPRLDRLTNGLLTSRFVNTRLTGRDRLIIADLQAFADHPLFGVGPGQGREYRLRAHNTAAAHTEFTRLLGEHGIFGIIAIGMLLLMAFQHLQQKSSLAGKAFTSSLVVWSFLFMTVSAMRLAAPAFAFGLAAIRIIDEKKR